MEQTLKYSTRDMYLAAAMMAEGVKYLEADRTDPRKIIFVFEKTDEVSRIEQEWTNGTLVGLYTAMADALRRIKSIIHAE